MRASSYLVYLPSCLGQETTKQQLRSSSQAAICYYQSNHLPGWALVASPATSLFVLFRSAALALGPRPSVSMGVLERILGLRRWSLSSIREGTECLLRGWLIFLTPLKSGQGLRFLRSSWTLPWGVVCRRGVRLAVGDKRSARSEARCSETHLCIRWGVAESVLGHLWGQGRGLASHLQ